MCGWQERANERRCSSLDFLGCVAAVCIEIQMSVQNAPSSLCPEAKFMTYFELWCRAQSSALALARFAFSCKIRKIGN